MKEIKVKKDLAIQTLEFTYVIPAVRADGVSFASILHAAAANPVLVKEFDRLAGCDLSKRGAPINSMIDEATGKYEDDMKKFIQFAWDKLFLRMPLVTEHKD